MKNASHSVSDIPVQICHKRKKHFEVKIAAKRTKNENKSKNRNLSYSILISNDVEQINFEFFRANFF